jgi:hypothetical protein
MDPDLDPAFLSKSGYGTRILMNFSFLFWSKIAVYPSQASIKDLQAIGEAFSALKREYPVLQKMKFNDCFLYFWAIFPFLYPDPDCKSESRSRNPIVSESKFGSGSVSTTLRIIVKNWIRIRIKVKIQKLWRLKTEPSRVVDAHKWRPGCWKNGALEGP